MIPIRVIIADDNKHERESIFHLSNLYKDIMVVGEAANGKELLDVLEQCSCDIVLLDIRMPLLNGIDALPEIRKRFHKIKIIMYTIYDDEPHIVKMIRAGAASYIMKDQTDSESIAKVIRAVMEHGAYYDEKVSEALNAN
jgi:DNA-binding NarL/FixJ family response regulator